MKPIIDNFVDFLKLSGEDKKKFLDKLMENQSETEMLNYLFDLFGWEDRIRFFI